MKTKPVRKKLPRKSTKFHHKNVKHGENLYREFTDWIVNNTNKRILDREDELNKQIHVAYDIIKAGSRHQSARCHENFTHFLTVDIERNICAAMYQHHDSELVEKLLMVRVKECLNEQGMVGNLR